MKSLKIGVCGVGNVGGAVIEKLVLSPDIVRNNGGVSIEIVQVGARKGKSVVPFDLEVTTDLKDVANNSSIDVFVELIGGCDLAKDLVEESIKNGKNIVTANKALIAMHGEELVSLAHEHNVNLAYEAAVAGGIPIIKSVREYLDNSGFTEVETPLLTKSTPEGARDFLVPARLSNGEFFALPQSPQLFKQLLMVGGLDKYYQIAKCFRDVDLRADRQPEFTQLDIEMSFISEEEIISFNEKLIKNIWKNVLNINFNEEFPRMTWQEAMDNYGTDRPDTRYEMLLKNLGGILGNIGFNIFTKAIQNGGAIKSITIKDGNTSISNVRIKPGGDIFKVAQDAGAGGLAFIRVKAVSYTHLTLPTKRIV